LNNSPGERPGRVAVIGAGAWGTTLSIVAHRAGNQVVLASHYEETVEHLRSTRTHPRSIAGARLPEPIAIESVAALEVDAGDIVILAIPVQRLRAEVESLARIISPATIVSAAKGIEVSTLKTPVAILGDLLPGTPPTRLAALSGPNLAAEIAAGNPATTVVASSDRDTATRIQRTLTSETFRVYTSDDVIGVEMGGALKNIVAIGAGIADGMGAGHNAKAAFMTRGIAEIARLGIACGAEPLTFAGLSGIGDLIATCGSERSRNHTVGRALAEGRALDEIVASMSETAEGVDTTRAAYRLAAQLGVNCPIINGMYDVLFNGVSPVEAARLLMTREPTAESISGDQAR
jgi:glycerol-3-phosphate dehydrogenase (NAD(P)+)